jgi:hypothetical protein
VGCCRPIPLHARATRLNGRRVLQAAPTFETSLGQIVLAARHKDLPKFQLQIKSSRDVIMSRLAALGTEHASYERAYEHILKLHMLVSGKRRTLHTNDSGTPFLSFCNVPTQRRPAPHSAVGATVSCMLFISCAATSHSSEADWSEPRVARVAYGTCCLRHALLTARVAYAGRDGRGTISTFEPGLARARAPWVRRRDGDWCRRRRSWSWCRT